jgi:hypothetical protein
MLRRPPFRPEALAAGAFATFALVAAASLLSACPGSQEPEGPSCEADAEMDSGELHATVDGEERVAETQGFQLSATGFNLAFTVDAHNTTSIRLVRSSIITVDDEGNEDVEEGDEVENLFEDGDFPADFLLRDGSDDGGDVTLVVEDVTYHTSEAPDPGFLRLDTYESASEGAAPVLRGCLYFDAATDGGDSVRLEAGVFAAEEM